jgi:hypothetical protein
MSTIRQILLFALSLALLLLLVKCKHEPVIDPNGPQCGEATTIDEMMEWVYFKTGTYWVYREQNTGVLDTMTVYYDYNGVSATGNREFKIKILSSLDVYTYEYWFNDSWSGDCSLFPGCYCRTVDCEKYKIGDFAGGNHVFIFPLRAGSQVWQSGGGENFGLSKIVNRITKDTILGEVYLNVYVFEQDYSPQHDYRESTYKISKNIGIIQKTVPEYSENWELMHYEIVH